MIRYFIFLILFFCVGRVSTSQVLTADSLALVDLYNNTNGASWTNKSGWLQPGAKVSSWYGVTLSGNRVISVNLFNNNLTGSLPSSIGNLTGLTQLILRDNKLTGTIPTSIGNLVNLKFLYLWNNQLTGSIPSTLGSMTALENLRLEKNQLSGSIPVSIENNTALKYLSLQDNINLSGAIPTGIDKLVNLEFLYLDNNGFTGRIPSEIGNLVKLRELTLSKNKLTGSIPTTISNLILLQKLVLSRNELTGSIPTGITSLMQLKILDLQDNNLTGEIPFSIGSINGLTDLLLGNDGNHTVKNQLTGSLPASISNLYSLVTFKVHDNALAGDVPELNSINLRVANLSKNKFTSLPDVSGLTAIESFDVRYNFLKFQDLYFNSQNLGTVFIYDPQQSYQVPADTVSYAVNSLVSVVVPDNSFNNTYSWSFTNAFTEETEASAITSRTYLISSLDSITMGTYTCVVKNSNINGEYTYTFIVNATADIEGTLFDEKDEFATAGYIELYRKTPLGSAYQNIDVATVGASGNYKFTGIVLGDYVLKGVVSSSNPFIIPTWYERSIYWEEATTLKLRVGETGIDIHAQVRPQSPQPAPDRPGSIGGIFFEEVPDAGRIEKRVGIPDKAVTVRRIKNTGRTSAEELILIDYVFTDADGKFFFDNLEAAEYRLNIQFPGYPMDETSFINIPIIDNLFGRHVEVEAELIDGKIVVRKMVITGWERESSGLQAYPNPSIETVYITGLPQESVTFSMRDGTGSSIQVQIHWQETVHRWELDIRSFSEGLYILEIASQGKTERLRIIVK